MRKIYNYFYTELSFSVFKLVGIDPREKDYIIKIVKDES